MIRHRSHSLAIASIATGLLFAGTARAGTYAKVNQSDWGAGASGLPTYVTMYLFTPSTTATKPPIVVVPHHCQGSASSSHSEMSSLESIADKSGFLIIYPEATGENCWDAGSTRSLKHGGGGDTGAIVQMVKYALGKYSGDANRVYTVGGSSGGIMTEALVGVYPDVFMAGISIMGVPCGCWAKGYNDTTGSGSTAQWSGDCAGGKVTMTGAQWGDQVRSYFPGYTGHRPRLQHWHGTSDTTLAYSNMAEDIKEWTNLLGLAETPSGTENNTPKSGTTHQFWKNSCFTVYETFALSGVGHAVSVDGATIATYFGLDKAGGEDPETAACPGAVPGGGGGTGGVSGGGGATGAGGSTGTTGSGGNTTRDGGGRDGSTPGTGGAAETGGSAGGTVAPGTGGSGGQGSVPHSGTGGSSPQGGTSGSGGEVAVGSGGSGGSTTTAKGGSSGSGGAAGSGGAVGSGGSSGGTSGSTTASGAASGCTCHLSGHDGAGLPGFALLALALFRFARRRGRR